MPPSPPSSSSLSSSSRSRASNAAAPATGPNQTRMVMEDDLDTLDAPLRASAPLPRWKRKQMEAAATAASLSNATSSSSSSAPTTTPASTRGGARRRDHSAEPHTPSARKSPASRARTSCAAAASPRGANSGVSKSNASMPAGASSGFGASAAAGAGGTCDRFIPNRAAMDMDVCKYSLSSALNKENHGAAHNGHGDGGNGATGRPARSGSASGAYGGAGDGARALLDADDDDDLTAEHTATLASLNLSAATAVAPATDGGVSGGHGTRHRRRGARASASASGSSSSSSSLSSSSSGTPRSAAGSADDLTAELTGDLTGDLMAPHHHRSVSSGGDRSGSGGGNDASGDDGATDAIARPGSVDDFTRADTASSLPHAMASGGMAAAAAAVAADNGDNDGDTRSLHTGDLERLLHQSEYSGMLAAQLGSASLVAAEHASRRQFVARGGIDRDVRSGSGGGDGDGGSDGAARRGARDDGGDDDDDDDDNAVDPERGVARPDASSSSASSCAASASSASPNCKILAFKPKPPTPADNYHNSMRVLYSQNRIGEACKRKAFRHIPQAPERILDAPDIVDDYYLNLLDWSSFNVLAVALGQSVYLWNADTGGIEQLLDLGETPADGAPPQSSSSSTDYVTSVRWVTEGKYLAVGTNSCAVQLWDAAQMRQLRSMRGHAARVGSLAWNGPLLSSGSRDSTIQHHDVRQAEHCVATLHGHYQEVCGLQWNYAGTQLASGSNDNLLNVWDAAGGTANGSGAAPPAAASLRPHHAPHRQAPRLTFDHHSAAVKALAWCPWQSNLLASGGGTADRTLRFWNASTGACLHAVDTHSQVCAIQWARHERELVTSHGFSQNQLCVWRYPSMIKTAELTGHTSRVLHMSVSPDGATVASAAADETLRFWRVFQSAAEACGGRAGAGVAGAKSARGDRLQMGDGGGGGGSVAMRRGGRGANGTHAGVGGAGGGGGDNANRRRGVLRGVNIR